MQALPREIEVEVEPKTDPEAENKEALLLAEIRSEEECQRKLRTPAAPTPTNEILITIVNDDEDQEEYL